MTESTAANSPEVVVTLEDDVVSAKVCGLTFTMPAENALKYAAKAFHAHVRRLTVGHPSAEENSGLQDVLNRGPEARRGRASGESKAKPGVLEAALMEVSGKTKEEVVKVLADMTPVQKRGLIRDSRLAAVYDRIKEERRSKPKEPVVVEALDALLG